MQLVTIELENRDTAAAVVIERRVFVPSVAERLMPELVEVPKSVKGIIASGEATVVTLKRAVEKLMTYEDDLTEVGALIDTSSVKLLAPIPDPTLILSCGMNYHEHLKEMNAPIPTTPTAFTKNAASVVGPNDSIHLPKAAPNMVDWEGELSVVIGRPTHGVSAIEALNHVAGYTVINDVSARDWVAGVFSAKGNLPSILAWEHNVLGKQFPTFCPMGPVIVTADEVGDVSNLRLETRLNGQVVQRASTVDLVFNVSQLIAYFSKFYRLLPGDLITTGSPSGVGYGRTPQLFMKSGDIVEVEIERIGILRNPVAAA